MNPNIFIAHLIERGTLQVHNDLVKLLRKKLDDLELCYTMTPPPWVICFDGYAPSGNVTRFDLIRTK